MSNKPSVAKKKDIEKTQSTTLVQQTQQQILEYIVKNNYLPNSILPKENELVEILGVSRVVVREALSSLRALGFLETKKKKGTVLVVPQIFGTLKSIVLSGCLDGDTIQDLYELRLMLEIGMADYLFKRKNTTIIAELQSITEQEETCESSDELRLLDIKFHSLLYKMSDNKSLLDFQYLLNKLFSIYAPRNQDWKKYEMITHRTLVEILKTGNPDVFRSAMRIHLERQFFNQEKYLKSFDNVYGKKS